MWPVVIGCVIGAALMGRTKPKAPVKKRELIGPATGNVYMVDDFNHTIIVHSPGCVCVFVRKPEGGFSFVNALGHREAILDVCRDLEPGLLAPPKKAATQ